MCCWCEWGLRLEINWCFFDSLQQSQPAATNGRFTTFGHDRYAHIPGEAPNRAGAMAIEASFSWREIPRDRVTLGKVLGEGEFGMVMKGELSEDDGRIIPCAVKKLKRMLISALSCLNGQMAG